MPRPEVPCCRPVMDAAWPSGPHWTHARGCPVSANMKVKQDDQFGQWYESLTEAQQFVYDHEPVSHPAGMDLPVGGVTSVRIARRHDPLCACPHCLHTSHWSDDNDDRTMDVAR